MYFKFLLFTTIAIGAVDTLFYLGILPLIKKYNFRKRKWINIGYWSFTLFSLIVLLIGVYHYAQQIPPPKFTRIYLVGFVFVVSVSKLFGILVFLVAWLLQLFRYIRSSFLSPKKNTGGTVISRGTFLRKTGIVAAMLPFLTMDYGILFGAFNFKIRKQKVNIPNLPSVFNGMKIIQISDIHLGSFISDGPIREAVKLINEQNGDLVLFTGDLVNEIAEEAEMFIPALKEIHAPLGVFSILGNHDYGDYYYREGDEAGRVHNRKKMKEIHKNLGWDLLLNEHRIIEKQGHKLGIIGSENWGKSARFQKYGDLNKAKDGMPTCAAKLLLTHDPSHWEHEVLPLHPDINLTFSGHTHGFQMGIEIPGFRWSPAQYLYKQWAGLYEKYGKAIYVNRGLGFIGFPGRLGIPPEITVLELSNSTA